MRLNNIINFGAVCMLAFLSQSCNTDENGIDDYPLNYQITEVKANQNIPVGCMLVNPYGDMSDASRWERLTEERNNAEGKIGPNVTPSAGLYRIMGTNQDEQDEYALQLGRIANEMKTAGIDFIITPAVRENANKMFPENINAEDSLFLNLISGRTQDLSWHNDGSTKFAIQINIQNLAASIGCSSYSSTLETRPDHTYNVDGETVTISQWERIMSYMKNLAKYFNDNTYYKNDEGRPVVIFRQPDQFFCENIETLYDDIRKAMKDVSGMDPYIIATQPEWSYASRFTYLVLNGKPDAIMPRNMANLRNDVYERLYIWDVATNENYKLNREYLQKNHPSIDFVPSVSNGYSFYVRDGRYDYPDMMPSADDLKKRCWIAKMNLGRLPMVIIDAYNDWGYGSFIEPTDPNVGNGVGDEYLKIIKSEFKL